MAQRGVRHQPAPRLSFVTRAHSEAPIPRSGQFHRSGIRPPWPLPSGPHDRPQATGALEPGSKSGVILLPDGAQLSIELLVHCYELLGPRRERFSRRWTAIDPRQTTVFTLQIAPNTLAQSSRSSHELGCARVGLHGRRADHLRYLFGTRPNLWPGWASVKSLPADGARLRRALIEPA